ncbi:hypothetical protein N9Z15_05155 [Akkermansiaceae bacterium]|nr:hypothetical protein [Akkermansiaceae bacterium]MDB4387572.1 hypothetical protein [Akkermansiaceae bacterium]
MKSRSFIISILTLWSASADTLSFKFQDTADTAFAEDVIAGAGDYADDHWNFLQGALSGDAANTALFTAGIKNGSGDVTTSLVDIGAANTPVQYASANTWRSGAGNADANATIMNGYLDDGNDDQPFVNFSLTASALPVYKPPIQQWAATGSKNGPILSWPALLSPIKLPSSATAIPEHFCRPEAILRRLLPQPMSMKLPEITLFSVTSRPETSESAHPEMAILRTRTAQCHPNSR